MIDKNKRDFSKISEIHINPPNEEELANFLNEARGVRFEPSFSVRYNPDGSVKSCKIISVDLVRDDKEDKK